MKSFSIYQVDAFSAKVFGGNPAAICPLEAWLPEELMQKIALENNLAETAFFVKTPGHYEIRWFTPAVEVDLCGHATLASAYVLFSVLGYTEKEISFYSHRSGNLKVSRDGEWMTLDFPTDQFTKVEVKPELQAPFREKITEAYKGKTDYMLVFDSAEDVKGMKPDLAKLAALTDCRGVIVTSSGKDVDFVSRFFAPQSGIDEDPVTGSAHTTLTPYWSAKLSKKELTAKQVSPREGFLKCVDRGDRTEISGQAVLYLNGEIYIK